MTIQADISYHDVLEWRQETWGWAGGGQYLVLWRHRDPQKRPYARVSLIDWCQYGGGWHEEVEGDILACARIDLGNSLCKLMGLV